MKKDKYEEEIKELDCYLQVCWGWIVACILMIAEAINGVL